MTSRAPIGPPPRVPPLPDPPYRLRPTFTRPLSLWNPLDYLRLLYWVFFHPQWIRMYVQWCAPEYPTAPTRGETLAIVRSNKRLRRFVAHALISTLFVFLLVSFLMWHAQPAGRWGSVLGVALGLTWGTAIALAGGRLGTLSHGIVIGAGLGVAYTVTYWVAYDAMSHVASALAARFAHGAPMPSDTMTGTIFITFFVALPLAVSGGYSVSSGVALGAITGYMLPFSVIAILIRLPLYFIDAAWRLTHARPDIGRGVRFAATTWMPLPGIRAELRKALIETPGEGVSLCVEYLDTSMQFISVIGAVNDVLGCDDGHTAHVVCRMLLRAKLPMIIGAASGSFWNVVGYELLGGLFVPDAWRALRFPPGLRRDTAPRAVCAAYTILSGTRVGRRDDPIVEVEPITALNAAIDLFGSARQAQHAVEVMQSTQALAASLEATSVETMSVTTDGWAWLDELAEPELWPEVLYALRHLRAVADDVGVGSAATSRAQRALAYGRANDTLRELRAYVTAECFGPQKDLLVRVIDNWSEIFTKAGGEVGRAAVPPRVIANNYVVGPALRNQKDRLFVGREDLYEAILRLWSNTTVKQPLLLYGQRRIGKTSLLLHMESHLSEAYLPIFLDLQTLATVESCGAFLFNLADKVGDELRRKGLAVPAAEMADYRYEPFVAFRKFVERTEAVVPEGRWVVLMMDEFELVEEKLRHEDFPPDLMLHLRNIMQHHPRFVLVLAGSHRLDEMRQDYWDPLLNIAHVRKVGYLTPEAARRLITNPWEDFVLDYEADAVDEIIATTGGHPLLLQAICAGVVDRMNERMGRAVELEWPKATLGDVNAEIERTLDGNAYFAAVLKALPPAARDLLRAIAKAAPGPRAWVDASSPATVDADALEALQRRDMIDTDGQRLRITVDLVRRWLLRRPA